MREVPVSQEVLEAVQAMKKARFQPHLEDGQARKVWVVAPLTFNLED